MNEKKEVKGEGNEGKREKEKIETELKPIPLNGWQIRPGGCQCPIIIRPAGAKSRPSRQAGQLSSKSVAVRFQLQASPIWRRRLDTSRTEDEGQKCHPMADAQSVLCRCPRASSPTRRIRCL
jgi:hypothetical protein